MGVHVNSVIDVGINNFDSALYTAITDKEEYCYDSTALGESFYAPFFTDLNTALTNWLSESTYPSGDTRETLIQDLIESMYTGYVMENIYSTPSNVTDSRDIFTIDGYRERIKTDPIDYYADGVVGTPNTANNLETDIELINDALIDEENQLLSSITSARGAFTSTTRKLLFEDIPQSGNTPLSKQDLGNLIFIDLHYKEIYENLNVGNLVLPSYI